MRVFSFSRRLEPVLSLLTRSDLIRKFIFYIHILFLYLLNLKQNKMAKLSNGVSGSSFHGVIIQTTVSKLRKAIGNPQGEYNDGTDKCNFDWDCETEDGTPFTIYDWKEYRVISETEPIDFHIGGKNQHDCMMAKGELLRQLR